MAASQMSEVIQHLRRAVLPREGGHLTDGQLLENFLNGRDEAALAALVRRHGPMVWGVCRRLLHNYHDAEDAFQATFLVLVRKAATVVPREMVGNWLYGVAHQTALKARATASRRKGRERQMMEMPEPAAAEPDLWCDLQPLLDEELSRLPEKYRGVVVLCDLNGKSRKEAARQLGVPEGTVAGWLARARRMLAKRLTQRGVTLSGGALAAVLTQNAALGGVPPEVASSAIKVASLVAAGPAAGVISPKVAALTEGVLKAMLLTKLKTGVAVLVVASMLLAGIGSPVYRAFAGVQPRVQEPPSPNPSSVSHALKDRDTRQQEDTAWGKPNKGLQLGLAFRHHRTESFRTGEKISCVVKARNVSGKPRTLCFIEPPTVGWHPTLEDCDGKRWSRSDVLNINGDMKIISRVLAPGEVIDISYPTFTVIPPDSEREANETLVEAPPGSYKMSYSHMFGGFEPGVHHEWSGTWATGEFGVRILPPKE